MTEQAWHQNNLTYAAPPASGRAGGAGNEGHVSEHLAFAQQFPNLQMGANCRFSFATSLVVYTIAVY